MAIEINKILNEGFPCTYHLITEEEAKNTKFEDIYGDYQILINEDFDKYYERMLKIHKPTSSIALISLCSNSRPYIKSRKWKAYTELFPNVDLLVQSNGGLYPQEFWSDFCALTYQAPSTKSKTDRNGIPKQTIDGLYQKKAYERVVKFFQTHSYDYIFFDFTKDQRNYKPAQEAGKYLLENKFIKGYDFPPENIKQQILDAGGYTKEAGSVGKIFPSLHKVYLDTTKEKIKKFL